MAASSAASARRGGQQLLSIGQVLSLLSPDFPDLSPSKLRFLEERGLVSPARTESGYRKFSDSDVKRLTLVLTLQRDNYLPLSVIKQYLADLDAGLNPPIPGLRPNAPQPSMLPTGRSYSRVELTRAANASQPLVQEALAAGLLPAGDRFTDEHVSVMRALVELQRSGIEPRHLRALRGTVERELSLIETALAPHARRRGNGGRAQIAELAGHIAGSLDVVRSSLIQSALRRLEP